MPTPSDEKVMLNEVYRIESVRLDREHGGPYGQWMCKPEFFDVEIPIPRGAPAQPRVGSEMRVWGNVEVDPQGIEIDGVLIYKRTDEEQQAREDERFKLEYAEHKEIFDKEKDLLFKHVAALPAKLRKRIEEKRAEIPDRLGLVGIFDVMHLDEELMICKLALSLELMVDTEASLVSFYEIGTVNKQRDSWLGQRDAMRGIAGSLEQAWGTFIVTFFHDLVWPPNLTRYQQGEIRELAFQLLSERSDERKKQMEKWMELRKAYELHIMQAAAADPAVQAAGQAAQERINGQSAQSQAQIAQLVQSVHNLG